MRRYMLSVVFMTIALIVFSPTQAFDSPSAARGAGSDLGGTKFGMELCEGIDTPYTDLLVTWGEEHTEKNRSFFLTEFEQGSAQGFNFMRNLWQRVADGDPESNLKEFCENIEEGNKENVEMLRMLGVMPIDPG